MRRKKEEAKIKKLEARIKKLEVWCWWFGG